jgi:hypothetical protein
VSIVIICRLTHNSWEFIVLTICENCQDYDWRRCQMTGIRFRQEGHGPTEPRTHCSPRETIALDYSFRFADVTTCRREVDSDIGSFLIALMLVLSLCLSTTHRRRVGDWKYGSTVHNVGTGWRRSSSPPPPPSWEGAPDTHWIGDWS